MPEWIGRNLGKVKVELPLARGGMAEVYLGKHLTLQRAVVVKVLRNQFEDDPELLNRFEREAQTVAMLRHPNIVQVFDFDTAESHPYIVMEYIPGISLTNYLQAILKQNQRVDLQFAVRLLSDLAGALEYAHERGIIHRDVKPGNIILTSPTAPVEPNKPLPADTHPILTDFGLVRYLSSSRQTTTGQISGTPAYMSPEQARGETVDTRTDIYSLGIVFYEMLAGHLPFEADSIVGVLNKQLNEAPAPIPGLDSKLQSVLDKALAKNPSDRYRTPNEFASAVRDVVEERAEAPTIFKGEPVKAKSDSKNIFRKALSNRRLSLGILAGLIVLIVLGIVLFRSISNSGDSYSYNTSNTSGMPNMTVGDAMGTLRFDDAAAKVDQVTMTATGMPLPPSGSQYEVWLVTEGGEQLRSMGVLPLDKNGNGMITFVDPQGRNLLKFYNKMEITVEPKPDPSPNPTMDIAFTEMLPGEGLMHVRHLIVAFDNTPNNIGLADGLLQDATLIDNSAQQMLASYQAKDDSGVRRNAEAILNVLVGSQSSDHRDWNGDGQITDPGDGFGMLLNGDNVGYIQGVYSHADYAASAPDATADMKLHGGHVKICAQNLLQWSPQLQGILKQILNAPQDTDLGSMVRQAVTLSDDILKGTDINGNEIVEPIPGEGGAETAYDHAYYMADMIIPKNP
jgi:serine/threonine protein kinase